MNLEFFVSRRKITRKGLSVLAADTANCDTFTIEFDREWDGLVKLVEFQNGKNTAQVFYTGKMPLPRQVCGRGDLYLTCYGYRGKDDSVALLCTVPMVRPVRMLGAEQPVGSMGQPYTPTAFDQMAALVASAEEAADNAKSVARELLELKDAGAFQGPVGPAATITVDSVRRGFPAQVENLGTAHHAILRFTLPMELSEAEKAALKEELLGDVDGALDEILRLQALYLGEEAAQ